MSIPAQGAVGAETMTADWRDLLANPDQVNIEYLKRAPDGGNWHVGSPYSRRQMVAAGHEIERLRAALASPRADSDERTAEDDWAATLARSILSREGYAYTHLVEAVATELRRIEAVGYTRGHEAGDAHRKAATPAQPAGAVPDSLRALSEAASQGEWSIWREPILSGEEAVRELTLQVEQTSPLASHLYLLNANGKCPATTGCGPTSQANANFIVAAVNFVRTLLASHPAGQSAGSGAEEPSFGDGRRICEALGFDPANHHNALKCPYCNPEGLALAARSAAPEASSLPDDCRLIQAEMPSAVMERMASNLSDEFGPDFVAANKAFALAVYAEAFAAGVRPAVPEAQGAERVRHVKRGSEYEVLGEAEAQISDGESDRFGNWKGLYEGDKLTVYRGSDGKLWCRFTDEFRDGRFVPAPPASSGQGGR